MQTSDDKSAVRQRIPTSHVVAVVLGNGLEFYNFVIYTLFSVDIAGAFFPGGNSSVRLLEALATLFVGFITRPIGAMVLGPMGDRHGRKPVMVLSFALMGLGMAGLALTPTYSQIGIAAPILVILFRLVQGFALGGEVGPTTAYMVEAAPPERRGFYGCMQGLSQDSSFLVASLVSFFLANTLTPAQFGSWGWRAAFLLGLVIVPFGIWLRNRLPETLHAADDAALAPDATTGSLSHTTGLLRYTSVIVICFALLVAGTIGTYTTSYMTTYARDTLHMALNIAFGVAVLTSLANVTFDLLSGILADRYGRKPVMIIPAIVLLTMIVPGFMLISHFHNVAALYGVMVAITIPASLYSNIVVVVLTESLPPRVRSGVVAMVYAFAISIFGGSTQFVIKFLIDATHNPVMPAYYWSIALAAAIVSMFFLKESAPRILAQRHALDGVRAAAATQT